MVFQDYALFPWMTVRQNIGFGPRQRQLPRKEVEDIADEFVKLVGLERAANRYPSQLSGGMKQRVAIARVLANNANILLMDEPFGALDALTREQLQRELLQIWTRTRVTILFVTHSVEEAALLADRVLVMSAGPGRIESASGSTCRARATYPRPSSTPCGASSRNGSRAIWRRRACPRRRPDMKSGCSQKLSSPRKRGPITAGSGIWVSAFAETTATMMVSQSGGFGLT